MKILALLFIFLYCSIHAFDKHASTYVKEIKFGKDASVKLDIKISKNLTFIGSFNLDDQGRSIDVYENTTFSLGDFLLVHDEEFIYILDYSKGKEVGKLPWHVLDQVIYIEPDKNGTAKITYTTATDSLIGENYHVPQALYHELIYKNGLYVLNE